VPWTGKFEKVNDASPTIQGKVPLHRRMQQGRKNRLEAEKLTCNLRIAQQLAMIPDTELINKHIKDYPGQNLIGLPVPESNFVYVVHIGELPPKFTLYPSNSREII
jgi:hypothetical protein